MWIAGLRIMGSWIDKTQRRWSKTQVRLCVEGMGYLKVLFKHLDWGAGVGNPNPGGPSYSFEIGGTPQKCPYNDRQKVPERCPF